MDSKQPTQAEMAAELGTLAHYIVDKCRACVPCHQGRGDTISGGFARAHEDFVQELIDVLQRNIPGLEVSIGDHYLAPAMNRTLTAKWVGTKAKEGK